MTDTIKTRAELDPEDFETFAGLTGFERSWAVVIGINDYGGEHATLANTVNDAREVARVLKDDFGFDWLICRMCACHSERAQRSEESPRPCLANSVLGGLFAPIGRSE